MPRRFIAGRCNWSSVTRGVYHGIAPGGLHLYMNKWTHEKYNVIVHKQGTATSKDARLTVEAASLDEAMEQVCNRVSRGEISVGRLRGRRTRQRRKP